MIVRNTDRKLNALCLGLISIGVILRCYHYIMSRSLWVDEAMVGLNIVNSSFAALIHPLKYGQLKPIGFLFIERCLVEMFGKSEYALRAFPLICGILSIFIFYFIAKKIFDRSGVVVISLGLFVFADRLIYYSSEVQPYSSDVFFSLLLIWMFLLVIETNYSRLYILLLLLIGIVSVWISLPSTFVLASIGGVCFYQFFKKQQKIPLYYGLCCGIIWLISFSIHYSILKYNLLSDDYPYGFRTLFEWNANHKINYSNNIK